MLARLLISPGSSRSRMDGRCTFSTLSCKWFHVCEHESHHAGQIDMLKKRLPGAKPDA